MSNLEKFELIRRAESLLLEKESFLQITLIQTQGSSPQNLAAKMIITDKNFWGTIGGGKLEAWCLKKAREQLVQKVGLPSVHSLNLQTDLGMSCGGAVQLLFEPYLIETHWQIFIFGAGHVAQAFVPLLLKLECFVTVVDSRADWLEKFKKHQRLELRLSEKIQEQVASIPPKAFIALMTMGHATDLPILAELMKYEFPFVGVIGSQVKGRKIRQELLDLGAVAAKVSQIHCPFGEDFGDNSPIEISFSLIAQLLKHRDQA